jgi:hypothetical protein
VKLSFFLPSMLAVSLAGASLVSTVHAAQEPQPGATAAAPGADGRPQRNYPKPTNLKVLPKDLTGSQVRDVMHKWAGDLGTECKTCHAEYADHRKDERGRPELDFAQDTKPEKKMARIMFKMMEGIKKDPIEKVKLLDEDAKDMNHPKPAELTCGTCHRGKVDPEAYVPPRREARPAAPGMPGMQRPPTGN